MLVPSAVSKVHPVISSVVKGITGRGVMRAGRGCYNNESNFNGVFSRDDLPTKKYGAYVINLDDKQSKVTNCISLFIDQSTAVHVYSFGIEYIPQ